MGLELFPVFLAAGLPGPSLRMDALIGGGEDFPYDSFRRSCQKPVARYGEPAKSPPLLKWSRQLSQNAYATRLQPATEWWFPRH